MVVVDPSAVLYPVWGGEGAAEKGSTGRLPASFQNRIGSFFSS